MEDFFFNFHFEKKIADDNKKKSWKISQQAEVTLASAINIRSSEWFKILFQIVDLIFHKNHPLADK